MKQMKNKIAMLVVATGMCVPMAALAQEVKEKEPVKVDPSAVVVPPPAPTPPPPPEKKAPAATWSSPDIEAAAKGLLGSWKTSAAVKQGEGSGSTYVVLSVAHVGIEGLSDTLYVEAAREDSMHKPFRQAVWQFYKKGDKLRMRTMEFRTPAGDMASATGTWAAPVAFPAIDTKNLIGTLDMDVTNAGGKLGGKTPYPYPTARDGAVEMTSEFTVSGDKMETIDRGLAADGKVVWGSGAGEKYTFTKTTTSIKATTSSDGLTVIDYAHPTSGDAAQNDGRIAVHYTGALANGKQFDTSRERSAPYVLTVGSPMPMGIAKGLEGVKKGDLRRVVIPAALGFGEQGNRRAQIPPNATLFYEFEVLDVEPPPPAAPAAAPGAPGQPGSDVKGTPAGVKIEPIDPSKLPFDTSKVVGPGKTPVPENPPKEQPK